MLVLTSNQYLKLGFEALIRQQRQNINGHIIIFDTDERLYILQETGQLEYYQLDFYDILTKSECFSKKEVDTSERFFRCMSERMNKVKKPYKKSSDALSRNEVLVIDTLLKGWSTFEVAELFNKSIKTVSAQKNRALRKLGARNMQTLHRTVVQWKILTKEFNSILYNRSQC
ncbi:LuxR C-terminal-related transcriptional regulator [Salmonella enterica]|nr:response regulator transcription factor [Salmonella enterica]EJA5086787.1 response regulator transcription factor [Salmonella enterica]